MTDELHEEERPIERAARIEAETLNTTSQNSKAEREADMLVADVDAYIARTDPASLPEAEAALEAWQIPTTPLDSVPDNFIPETSATDIPLVSIFSARNESEANIVKGVLEAEGIAVIFREVATSAYGSVFSVSEARWADLLVAASEAEQAGAVILEATQQNPENQGEGQVLESR